LFGFVMYHNFLGILVSFTTAHVFFKLLVNTVHVHLTTANFINCYRRGIHVSSSISVMIKLHISYVKLTNNSKSQILNS